MEFEKIVLFCKSYEKDLYRAKRLADSVDRFNVDSLPFYMSVPEQDIEKFKKALKENNCILLTDEEILEKTSKVHGEFPSYFANRLMQQLVKLEFWRMNASENYAWIDSDTYFIKDFKTSDFMYDRDIPYTILQEFDQEEKKRLWKNIPKKERDRRIKDRVEHIEYFRGLFDNEPHSYDFFGSTPIIWSCKVLKDLNERYLLESRQSIYRLLADYPCEFAIYGNYLLKNECIPIHSKRHMFKNYDYLDEFMVAEMNGENEHTLSKRYWGVCFQSNWTYFRTKKTLGDRLRNRKQELFYFISRFFSANG